MPCLFPLAPPAEAFVGPDKRGNDNVVVGGYDNVVYRLRKRQRCRNRTLSDRSGGIVRFTPGGCG